MVEKPPTSSSGIIFILVNYIRGDEANVDDGISMGKASLNVQSEDRTIYADEYSRLYEGGQSRLYVIADDGGENIEDLSANQVTWQLDIEDCDDNARFNVSFGSTLETDHMHKPQPGIIEEFDGHGTLVPDPDEMKILVNGSEVASSFDEVDAGGDNQFRAMIDATDVFDQGEINLVEIESGEIGHLMVWVEGDVGRQIIGGG